MIDAIYTGLLYGIIGAASVAGFALTILALYGLIEVITFILGLHSKYFTTGDDYDGRKRGRD